MLLINALDTKPDVKVNPKRRKRKYVRYILNDYLIYGYLGE